MSVNTGKTFKSILNTNTRYLKRWLNILCSTEEYRDLFVSSFLDITDLECSMFEFQVYLKFSGRGQDISVGQIEDSINKRDTLRLKALLQELLLIPVDNTEIAKVLKIKEHAELEDFIDKIKAYSNTRYARVIDEYFCYDKTG